MSTMTKTPRVYVDHSLSEGIYVEAIENTHHYLKNVLRVIPGDAVRLFNGHSGEFVGRVDTVTKKLIGFTIENRLREQISAERTIHLYFALLKKERLDWLFEKAVELGATDFHPVLTQNADIRKLNDERARLQIIEAAEQCERLDIPRLHPIHDMSVALKQHPQQIPLYAAIERLEEVPLLSAIRNDGNCGILIGPAGGFDEAEREQLLASDNITPVNLGPRILRAETAAIAALSIISLG